MCGILNEYFSDILDNGGDSPGGASEIMNINNKDSENFDKPSGLASQQAQGDHNSTANQERQMPYRAGEIISFGGYDWIVLKTGQNTTLIITVDIIEKRAYNVEYKDVTWETSALRTYLNGEFYNRFSDEDKKWIARARNDNLDNEFLTRGGNIRETQGGNPTNDHIFLLSISEVKEYFRTKDITAEDTGYWDTEKIKKIPSWGPSRYPRSEDLAAAYAGKAWRWWLRSPGFVSNHAAYVYDDGTVNMYGYNVRNAYAGVRPALYLLNP